jgi:hypothetical protein
MSPGRTAAEALTADAADAATAALRAVGLDAEASAHGVLRVRIDDSRLELIITPVSYCTGQRARQLIRAGRHLDAAQLVVAKRMTTEAKALLSDAGWSWLDRRGRLHLHGPGVRVDIDVPVDDGHAAPSTPIAGRGGLVVAYWLCAHPGDALSPTKSAASLRLAPSTISTAVRRLADAGLADDQGVGIFPELFWELANAWRPERSWLLAAPDAKRHGAVDPEQSGWRRSGTAAAAAYGAPVVAAARDTLELYVPGPVEVSIASRTYGVAQPGIGPASIAVAPVSAVVAPPPTPRMIDGWVAAPVLAVALDLAQDRARGREILQDWEIDGAVWR